MLRYGLLLPPLGDFADPRTQAALAVEAELAGWDGYFALDVDGGSDPYIVLAAVACATTRLSLGVVDGRPLPTDRRVATIDQLSGGRWVAADAVARGRDARHEDGTAADFPALVRAGVQWWLETVTVEDSLGVTYAMISAGPPGR